MSTPSEQPVPVQPAGTGDNPHAHLDPVVAAEVRWGNRVERDWHITDPHFGYWDLTLARPFHLERLRAEFRFPPTIGLAAVASRPGGQRASMSLGDSANLVGITAPLPAGWPDADADIGLNAS
ncbi:hypothetical protein V2S66_23305 [Streptomyces sp. V4-01]|uniref:Uncharacterized protein n=1 Tax=Actinacidiphila polyblastidii TaxID=3110430 RepID=A0ABU7PGD5_9ACTN|nr:hypothetical protein [Streptomyces sp. V4-01]